MAHQKADPLHDIKGVRLTNSFSNAFSNADDYVQSRTDIGEIKRP
jgi:ppGpp synthetase/RelA/SpoT-type nucleotidyltranferase